jgi:FMN phosphatase YigB (HAD superfamily)
MARGQHVVFFDVGNVLIDDDPFLAEAFRLIHQHIHPERPKAQLERFWGDVERALRAHGHRAVERLGVRCHGRQWPKLRKRVQKEIQGRWWEIVRPVPGTLSVLELLRESYRLGIIAKPPSPIQRFFVWHLRRRRQILGMPSWWGTGSTMT